MLAIDHLVIAAKDPKQAASDFGEKYNVKTIQGGKHKDWGTYNYLAYLANNCYIEWIGIFAEDLALKSTNPLIQQLVHTLKEDQEGLFQIAFRTENMNQLIYHFTAENIPFKGPIEGSRKKPDGQTLAWKMLFPHPDESNQPYPFLIEWGEVDNRPDDQRDINTHALNCMTVSQEMMAEFVTLYRLTTQKGKIKLSNGTICFSQSVHFHFSLT